jgi:hypothetical protein
LPFKCNLQRYSTVRLMQEGGARLVVEEEKAVVGLCTSCESSCDP